MNAADKAAASLLRLKEFISHISQNYLCSCQQCAIGAGEGEKFRAEPQKPLRCYNGK